MGDDKDKDQQNDDQIAINEVQLLLAEKRTSLAMLRTGIAVFALPLSVLSFLIVTSKYYQIDDVLPWLVPLLTISTFLIVLGVYLIYRSVRRLLHYDKMIMGIKKKHGNIAEYIE